MGANASVGFWNHPFEVARNNFKFKSLSCWSANPAVGCLHACRFCYVPEVSTRRMGPSLAPLGVTDPDAQWGSYAFLRKWDREHWRRSIAKAEATPVSELNPDGNRAVMFSTTTDPFQVWPTQELRDQAEQMIVEALEDIRDRTTLNVRILTRSPLARNHAKLFRSFGNRLLFGMSIPTLDDRLARIYEPHAPASSQRLKTLEYLHSCWIPTYVAMAPVYPDCDGLDMHRTLAAIAPLNPVTVFMEPLNIRAENVDRIRKHAASVGASVNLGVFETPEKWRRYAVTCLHRFQSQADLAGLEDRLHLWPDASLGSRKALKEDADWMTEGPEAHLRWLQHWWNRVSEWPTMKPKP